MSTTRNGKIARLPRAVRQQVNTHLDDGMEAEPLLAWVNALPETQALLREKFDGKAINPQNLSEWRQGGYQDWLRNQQRLELAEQMMEQGQELDEVAKGPSLSNRLGLVLTVELAARVKEWQAGTDEPKERWRQLRELLRELGDLRREEHRAQRARIAQEKWSWAVEDLEEAKQQKMQRKKKKEIEDFCMNLRFKLHDRGVGGSERIRMASEVQEALSRGKPLPQWARELLKEEGKSEGRRPKPEGSPKSEIRNPNPKKAEDDNPPSPDFGTASEEKEEGQRGRPDTERRGQSRAAQRYEGESKPIKPNQTENDGERRDGTNGMNETHGTKPMEYAEEARPQGDAPDLGESNPIKANQGVE
jgi:hypothetical protein